MLQRSGLFLTSSTIEGCICELELEMNESEWKNRDACYLVESFRESFFGWLIISLFLHQNRGNCCVQALNWF